MSTSRLRFAQRFYISLAVLTLLITGCGGGGGGGGTPVTANLTVTSISVTEDVAARAALGAPSLYIGHPFTVEVGIYSAEAAYDVSVDFYIVDQAGFDAPGGDPGDDTEVEVIHYHVGSAMVGDLVAGENLKRVELTLPYTSDEDIDPEEGKVVYGGLPLDPELQYYLFAELDPANLIPETNEDDNRPSEETLAQTMVGVSVVDTYMDIPNLILGSVLLEVPDFELKHPDTEPELDSCGDVIETPPEQNVDNAHLGVTAELEVTGRYVLDGEPKPIPRVEVQATLITPGLSIMDVPVLLWDSAANQYTDTLRLEDVETSAPTSVSLDLRLGLTSAAIEDLIVELSDKAATCAGGCFLDRECFMEEMLSPEGSCDSDDLFACGGNITALPPPNPPVFSDPDWGCFISEVDGICIDACEPDLDCLLDCTREFVDLEVTAKAYNALGEEISGAPPEFLLDDDLQIELTMLPPPKPPATGPVRYETGFDKSFSAKLLYAGLSANAYAGLDGDGASAGLEAALPVVLFRGAPSPCDPNVDDCLLGYKSGEVFLGVRSALAVSPVWKSDNRMTTLDIYAFGQNLYPNFLDMACGAASAEEFSSWQLGGKECVDACPDPPSGSEPPDPEYQNCMRECGAFGKTKGFEKDLFVGPVPLTSSFSAWGLIGAMASLERANQCNQAPFVFTAQTGPWADLGTELTAGVGSSKLFSFGIGGSLDPLFADTFYATVAMNDLIFDADEISVKGTLHEDVTNTLTGPEGSVFLYVGYPCIKVCRKWGIPYPCGFKQCKKKKPIAGFKTFEIEDVLFCEEQQYISGTHSP